MTADTMTLVELKFILMVHGAQFVMTTWDNIDASVVCKQLGFSTYGIFSLADWFLNWIINYNVGAIAKTSFYTETYFSTLYV